MRPVALQELKQLGDGKHWSVEQQLSELDSIGPVKGWLKALHRGDDLWLEAEAKATVELICDRCLKSYPQPLQARVSESIALQSGGPDAELEELEGVQIITGVDVTDTAGVAEKMVGAISEPLDYVINNAGTVAVHSGESTLSPRLLLRAHSLEHVSAPTLQV